VWNLWCKGGEAPNLSNFLFIFSPTPISLFFELKAPLRSTRITSMTTTDFKLCWRTVVASLTMYALLCFTMCASSWEDRHKSQRCTSVIIPYRDLFLVLKHTSQSTWIILLADKIYCLDKMVIFSIQGYIEI